MPEKFYIDPEEEKRRHEEVLGKIDDVTAGILRKHLTYSTPLKQEELRNVEDTPKEPPKKIRDFKTHIVLSQPRETDNEQ